MRKLTREHYEMNTQLPAGCVCTQNFPQKFLGVGRGVAGLHLGFDIFLKNQRLGPTMIHCLHLHVVKDHFQFTNGSGHEVPACYS